MMQEDLFKTSHYDYVLPPELIAQEPLSQRDKSRLLLINRRENTIQEAVFTELINFLHKGDVLVLNNTKVLQARFFARRAQGGTVELLFLRRQRKGEWEVLAKPGKRARVSDELIFEKEEIRASVIAQKEKGARIIRFESLPMEKKLFSLGKPPLPPYIKKEISQPKDYQTVYAQEEGAIAAPTAGLHFTSQLLERIREKGVNIVYITLHCGTATFRPVQEENISTHHLDAEYVHISSAVSEMINHAKCSHQRIIAVGTTSVRALESAACREEETFIKPFSGPTRLYIVPGYQFKIIDCLLTNFHTPRSTNLILTSCFCGKDLLKASYSYAIAHQFRFYSFGDAMFIT